MHWAGTCVWVWVCVCGWARTCVCVCVCVRERGGVETAEVARRRLCAGQLNHAHILINTYTDVKFITDTNSFNVVDNACAPANAIWCKHYVCEMKNEPKCSSRCVHHSSHLCCCGRHRPCSTCHPLSKRRGRERRGPRPRSCASSAAARCSSSTSSFFFRRAGTGFGPRALVQALQEAGARV